MSKRKSGNHRHAFRFRIRGANGKTQEIISWAKVIFGTKRIQLDLKADDVRRSIQLRGVGNTQNCSMAVCALRQAEIFPHPVEGFIDWQYSRAYVVSKVKNGLPIECVAYRHNDSIALLNDTAGGQKKLLSELVANGDRKIYLTPQQDSKGRKHPRPPFNSDGSRKSKVHAMRGGKLRFAVAQLGGAFAAA